MYLADLDNYARMTEFGQLTQVKEKHMFLEVNYVPVPRGGTQRPPPQKWEPASKRFDLEQRNLVC